MTASEFSISYDSENDVFYVIKKDVDRSATVNLSVDSDIVMRIARKSHEVVGFTITDFSQSKLKRLKDRTEYEQMEEFDFLIKSLNAMHGIEHQKT